MVVLIELLVDGTTQRCLQATRRIGVEACHVKCVSSPSPDVLQSYIVIVAIKDSYEYDKNNTQNIN